MIRRPGIRLNHSNPLGAFRASKPTTPSVEPFRRRITQEPWSPEISRSKRVVANIRAKAEVDS